MKKQVNHQGNICCQGCYRLGEKAGKEEGKREELKFLRSILQSKNIKELSKVRTQDTGRKTIPDMYDAIIKQRIKQIEKEK